MFEKIVVVDSTGLNTWGVERLKELGKEVVFYTGIPETDEEIVNRIGDADCSPEWYNFQHSGKICPARIACIRLSEIPEMLCHVP
mgnify:FL=1